MTQFAEGIKGRLLELQRDGFAPKRILDIGANIGQFAYLCRTIWPEAHITCIEPNELCAEHLFLIADEPHIALLADSEREVTFWSHSDNPWSMGASYYKESLDCFPHDVATQRTTTTLSNLLAGKEPYDFVKLDTQGSELDIIRGGRDIIRQAAYVLCEMPADDEPTNIGAPVRSQVEAELASLGFGDGMLLEWWQHKDTKKRINEDWIYRRTNA